MKSDIIELLQQMPIFGGINEGVLEFIMDSAETISVAKGDFFFHENQRGACMYVLQRGTVAVIKEWEDKYYLLSYLKQGDCFGEMELIDFCPRAASILAVEASTAIKVLATTLHDIYKQDVKQYAMIQMNMGREVSRRLRVTDEHLFELRIRSNTVYDEFSFGGELNSVHDKEEYGKTL